MSTGSVLVIFAGLFLGWGIQIGLSLRQASAFRASVRSLQGRGATAVGRGGSRYRGLVYVVLAVDEDGRVTAAETLRGLTVFARPRPAAGLVGRLVTDIAGTDPESTLEQAARQAAMSIVDHDHDHEAAKEVTGTQTLAPHQEL